MSRHVQKINETQTAAYGYDDMMPSGGFFFQVMDSSYPQDQWDASTGKMIVNEGFVRGISRNEMVKLMTHYKVGTEEQFMLIAGDLPI